MQLRVATDGWPDRASVEEFLGTTQFVYIHSDAVLRFCAWRLPIVWRPNEAAQLLQQHVSSTYGPAAVVVFAWATDHQVDWQSIGAHVLAVQVGMIDA